MSVLPDSTLSSMFELQRREVVRTVKSAVAFAIPKMLEDLKTFIYHFLLGYNNAVCAPITKSLAILFTSIGLLYS